jgi:radical SAM protein with 4Fe4S-binding SPASM domain
VRSVTLITNGSHVARHAAALAEMGLGNVQLTLLSDARDHHDRLKGAVCFDDTVRAAFALRQHGVPVTCCFVAMRDNADRFEGVVELCAALGIDAVSYNRMSPTGGAVHHIAAKMPTVAQIEANLEVAQRLGPPLRIRIATAMPIPPCLIRVERYPWVQFGFCSTGTHAPNIVVDVAGNVRSCNLSSGILGNLVDQDWSEIAAHPYPRRFREEVPEMCRGCHYERSCNGGCKESGFATFGDHTHPEPLLWLAMQGDDAVLPVAQR